MTRKSFIALFVYFVALAMAVSCEGDLPVDEGDLYNASENESFVENPLLDDSATRLWTTPVNPNADGPVTISFKAGKKSALRGYKGEVYAHIGILEYGTWKYVQADWNVQSLPAGRTHRFHRQRLQLLLAGLIFPGHCPPYPMRHDFSSHGAFFSFLNTRVSV